MQKRAVMLQHNAPFSALKTRKWHFSAATAHMLFYRNRMTCKSFHVYLHFFVNVVVKCFITLHVAPLPAGVTRGKNRHICRCYQKPVRKVNSNCATSANGTSWVYIIHLLLAERDIASEARDKHAETRALCCQSPVTSRGTRAVNAHGRNTFHWLITHR